MKRLAAKDKLDVTGSSITGHVGLGILDHGFALEVTLEGRFPTLDAAAGLALMEKAHEYCPYSRATRGNIDVTLKVAE